MAAPTFAFGVASENARPRAAGHHGADREAEVCSWIASRTGESQGEATLGDWLHDGVVLCKLANGIKPGAVVTINETRGPHKQRENIGFFREFCRSVGVPEFCIFNTDALFEERDMGSVISTLCTLEGVVQKKMSESSQPQPAVNAGLTQHRRSGAGGLQVPSACTRPRSRSPAPVDLDYEISAWIHEITGEAKGSKSTHEWLQSGRVLCILANTIKPGSVEMVNTVATPSAAFKASKERENIKFFQKFMRDSGVVESSMFSTGDLHEEKNMATFLKSMAAFAGAVQKVYPDFAGPRLGPAIAHCMPGDTKRRDLMALSQTEGMQRAMQVARPKDTGITAGAKAAR